MPEMSSDRRHDRDIPSETPLDFESLNKLWEETREMPGRIEYQDEVYFTLVARSYPPHLQDLHHCELKKNQGVISLKVQEVHWGTPNGTIYTIEPSGRITAQDFGGIAVVNQHHEIESGRYNSPPRCELDEKELQVVKTISDTFIKEFT